MSASMSNNAHAFTFIWTDMDQVEEDEFNHWYNTEHMVERVQKIPGYISGRRFINQGIGSKYFAIYRVNSAEVFHTAAYLDLQSHPDENSRYFIPRFQNVFKIFASLGFETGQGGEGAHLALIPFIQSFPTDVEHETVKHISQALNQVHLQNGLVATQYLKTNWDIVESVTSKFLRKTDTYFHGAILLEATNAKSLKKSIDELEELVLGQLEPFLHSTRVNYLEQILSFHPKIS